MTKVFKIGVVWLVAAFGSLLLACDDTNYAQERVVQADPDPTPQPDTPSPEMPNPEPEVVPEPEDRAINFVLENGGREAIFIQTSDATGRPTWFSVEREGSAVPVMHDCAICPCDETSCGLCGAAFGQAEEVLPGATASWRWEGLEFARESQGGGVCERVGPAVGDLFEVRMCWGSEVIDADDGTWVSDPVCETVSFVLEADGEARVITPPPIPGGEEIVETVGWFTEGFEHYGFNDGDSPPGFDSRTCTMSPEFGTSWWVNGELEGRRLRGGFRAGLVSLTAARSPEGQHGHLGSYPHEIDVIESELLVCETAAVLGACVLPNPGDICAFAPHMEGHDAFAPEYRTSALELDAADPDGTAHFTLTVTYDHPLIADEAFAFELAFTLGFEHEGEVEVTEARDPRMRIISYGFGVIETPLEGLTGTLHFNLAERLLRVDVTGLDDRERPVRLWGAFSIDDGAP